MKTYRYDSRSYLLSVTVTGVFCALLMIYSAYMLAVGNTLFWVVLLVSAYQVLNTFVSVSNPSRVEIGEDAISFTAYGKTHRYPLGEITAFHMKEVDPGRKMYVRVNESTLLRGRYWIACKNMNDGGELWDYFAYLEYLKDPGKLKFQAKIPKNPLEKEPEEASDLSVT